MRKTGVSNAETVSHKQRESMVGKRVFLDFTEHSIIELTGITIEMYFAGGYTTRRLAASMGISVGRVRRMLDKYRTPKGLYDITINIMSKV